MENNNQSCLICGATLQWKEPGKRQDGSTYPGFYGCPNYRNHPKSGYVKGVAKPNRQEAITKAIEDKNHRIDAAIDRRDESITVWASINNATAIVAQMKLTDTKDIIDKIGQLAEGIRSVGKLMKREEVFQGKGFNQEKYNAESELEEANIQLMEEENFSE